MANIQADASTDDAEVFHKEVEVLLAEMETRLRRSVLKVIRPTLDQVTELGSRVAVVEKEVEQLAPALKYSETVQSEVRQMEGVLDVVRERLGVVSQKADDFEAKATTELADLRTHDFRSATRLDNVEGEIHKIVTDISYASKERERLQQEHERATQNIMSSVVGGSRQTEKARDELKKDITEAHRLHFQLVEDLWGDGKALTQIRVDLQQLNAFVEPLPRLETQIDNVWHKTDLLEDVCRAATKTSESVTSEFAGLKASVNTRLKNAFDENKSAMNKLTAYHASILKTIRSDFNEEIKSTKTLREDIGKFESGTREFCTEISTFFKQEIARLDALQHELAVDISGVDHRRKRDHTHVNDHLQRHERDLHLLQETSEHASRRLEHLGKVIALVLEGEKMSSALIIQEFGDRCCESWLGTAADGKRKPPTAHTAQTLEKWQPTHEHLGKGFAGDDLVSLVPVNSQTGFAKLGYMPGAISYGGKHFDRKGFLLMHHQMLTKARQFLEHPPSHLNLSPRVKKRHHARHEAHPDDDANGAVKISLQPAANGGQGGSQPSGLTETGGQSSATADFLSAVASDAVNISLQPAANGGQGGSELPGLQKIGSQASATEEFKPGPRAGSHGVPATASCSDGFHRAACSDGFQRPGSQHQPQAMGSKGFQLGPASFRHSPADDLQRLPSKGVSSASERVMASTSGLPVMASPEIKKKSVDLSLRAKPHTAR